MYICKSIKIDSNIYKDIEEKVKNLEVFRNNVARKLILMELWTQDRSHAHHDYVPIHARHLGVMHAQPRKALSIITHT